MKNCCVIGLGYIGLPTALLIAKSGLQVCGVDINKNVIDSLNSGEIHIVETGLSSLLEEVTLAGSFKASTIPSEADVYILAVPTPFIKKDAEVPEPDISFVLNAIKSISPFLKKNNLVILESTCPVGTTEIIEQEIISNTKYIKGEINVAYCPERVLPGNILYELVHNDRVIGGLNKKSSNITKEFYSYFCKGNFYLTEAKVAELVKLTENSFRDVNIAFANEMSLICDEYNINVYELINLCNQHPRVNILNPGCGVGGHCIAVDPWFVVSRNPKSSNLIKMGRKVNLSKTDFVIEKVIQKAIELETYLKRKPKIACLGLTFKPDIDDVRESPSMLITKKLIDRGLMIYPCDPYVSNDIKINNYSIEFIKNNIDFYVILVGHSHFKTLNVFDNNYLDFCGLLFQK